MKRRGKKRKKDHDHIDETWLIPYADMLTLLLALFIVLFASSTIDAIKFQKLSSALNSVFEGGVGIFEQQLPIPDELIEPQQPDHNKLEEDSISKADSAKDDKKGIEREKLEQLQERINSYIKENNLDSKLQTYLSADGLMVTIVNEALFASGSAEVIGSSQKLAHEMSELLVSDPPRNIVISGHTDSIPINNNQFDSNWHLSVMRAVNFMKVLLENQQLQPANFSARGYGEHKPIATNKTSLGRSKNRRVEVLILPNY